jgi:LysM repeat protein
MKGRVHVVRAGERLTEIAARYGLTTEQIIELNPHKDVQVIENVPLFVALVDGEALALPPGLVYS